MAILILARGGSKGIILKNLAKIGNKTLLEISLKEIKKANYNVDSIWVSTDHEKIGALAERGTNKIKYIITIYTNIQIWFISF